MAGTARTVPAISPLRTSCAISRGTSAELQQLEPALLRLLVPELRVEDVADLVEVARSAGAVEIDVLALREQLEPLGRAVHAGAPALRDLPHVVADARARGLPPGVRDGEDHQADVVVRLAGVRVEIVVAERLGQPLVGRRLDRGRRRDRPRAFGDLRGQGAEELLVDRVGLRDLGARVTG